MRANGLPGFGERACLRLRRGCLNALVFVVGILVLKGANCGRIKRFLNANYTDIETTPYMLSMRFNDNHICGAVIIGEHWSLTAAHCCLYQSDDDLKKLTMRSGSASLHEGGMVHQVVKLVRHPQYTDLDDDYDICAVKIEAPGFDVNAAARLPGPKDDLRTGVTSGWGYYEKDLEELSPVLLSVDVVKVDLELCKDLYRDKYTVHDSNVCYKAVNSGANACVGDSGGPAVNNDRVLMGIVSFGDECGYTTLPDVYTNVRLFRDWIKNITKI